MKTKLSIAVLLGMLIGGWFMPYFPGRAFDLENHFVYIAQGDFSTSLYPFFMQWFIYPLGILPLKFGWLLLLLVTGLTVIKVSPNPLPVLLSAPFISCFFIGQVDVIPFIGLLLALGGSGLGWVMAFSKPQTVILGLFKAKLSYQSVLVIVIAAGISFVIYGWDWVFVWLRNLRAYPSHQYNQFYALFPLAILVLFTKRELPDLLAANAFVSSQYGHWVFLVLRPSWTMTVISWSWMLFPYQYRGYAMALLPFLFLSKSVYMNVRSMFLDVSLARYIYDRV